MPVNAYDLSCQGLTAIDPSLSPITFHGDVVVGYEAEMDRRGEGHVNTCDLIGHRFEGRLTGPCSGCLRSDAPTINYGLDAWLCGNCQANPGRAADLIASRAGDAEHDQGIADLLRRYAHRAI
ncbi:hypothetical protein AB0C69_10945 [Actinomadura sp. NPDC048032]|uniref:hypothetical protein n=1 Tax=Actinomadura sp. NPDC048032 TaxID=3155747 RepID=UPI0033D78387